mmetsp:Transcript_115717/g.248648  ORF Transcript_115717/g.248648 Transcript_115717/m.248648 type:complete len:104 (-) Transcript_115717:8-319(-)
MAYLAEASSIPLRLASLARRRGSPVAMVGALDAATLALFAASRMANGLWCLRLVWAARAHLAPATLRLQLLGAAGAYVMNAAWFAQLLSRRSGASTRAAHPPA